MYSRRLFEGVALIGLCLVFTGCPLNPPRNGAEFRSADVNGRNFGGGLYAALEGNGDASEETAPPEREVVEPDIIRQDGDHLYILNQFRGLLVVDLPSNSLVAHVPTQGYPRDLYIRDDRAYVLVSNATDYEIQDATISHSITSRLHVVDIANPANPVVQGSGDVPGDLVASRLVGGVLYAVTTEYDWYYLEVGRVKAEGSATWMSSFDVSDPNNMPMSDQVAFDGQGTVIHVTPTAAFVAAPDWESNTTAITYLDITDPQGAIAVRGTQYVAGQVADRYKLDVHEDVLRVVSSAWQQERRVYVTTLDASQPDTFPVMAEMEFLSARGDTLFATRFDGDKAYVVTYFIKDPLYVVDLSDPANPQITGELEVPGWSTHIEPMGDRLVALGVDDTRGRQVSVSLFDVADPAQPSLIERVTFGENWSWSSAFQDVKAFNVVGDLILVPFSGWEDDQGYDRLQFVTWTPQGLEVRGNVDVTGEVLRSLGYGGQYYAVTSRQLAAIDPSNLDEPEILSTLTLSEHVADAGELEDGLGVAVIGEGTGESVRVRSLDAGGETLGEVDVDVASFQALHVAGNRAVLWGVDHESSDPVMKVAVVEFSESGEPELLGSVDIDARPWYGGWYYPYYALDGPAVAEKAMRKMQKIAIWPPWYPAGDTSFLVDDQLVIRCQADSYTHVLGGAGPNQGLAVVDIETPQLTHTIGLGYERIESVDAAGDSVYITEAEDVQGIEGINAFWPMLAYYVRAINVSEPAAGPAANVPGRFLQYDPENGLLTLEDHQWGMNGSVTARVRTARWNGSGPVEPVDTVRLPNSSGRIEAGGSHVYAQIHDSEGFSLQAIGVSADGSLSTYSPVPVTSSYGMLQGAHKGHAVVSVGSWALAHYRFTASSELAGLYDTMSLPTHVRFGEDTGYAALGFSGLLEFPLN